VTFWYGSGCGSGSSDPGLWIRIHFFRIRIQHLRMDTSPDPDPSRIQGFNDQKLQKITAEKIFFCFLFSKTAIYLSLGLHKVCPSYRRSLQLSKEAIQHLSTFVGHFCPPGSGSGSTDPIESGSNPDPYLSPTNGSGSGRPKTYGSVSGTLLHLHRSSEIKSRKEVTTA
jgi:hypothetical protein